MSPEPAPDLIQLLEESRRELIDATAGLSDAEAVLVLQQGRWSVLQCVEHVTFVEERFAGRLAGAQRTETPPESRAARLAGLTANRTRRVQAPEPAVPVGRYTNLAEALEAFNSTRDRTIRIVAKRAADLPLLVVEHPFFGPLSGESLVGVMAGHSRRHAEQVREIRAALAQPPA